ncbi:hypothetical protein SKUN_00633 [Spiroplasma kunkelii CR2-3x]|uniref:Pentapeptide repeat-containing protein n=1 Tax=Spiroplasma kunkelii CR2-3x TaxID=273035 RepID=A0A0K2JH08_SPIKU|nr:pentapeptide repeat-containing protein [Spiroplasma kunkelii]ALA97526.1 hypothetical protein SKUN_00633 [Spiroplasma kunkelii CR2-3x]
MKTLQDIIKDLTGITVEKQKINKYLESERLDLEDADLRGANLKCANLKDADLDGAYLYGIGITKEQIEQLTVIEDD